MAARNWSYDYGLTRQVGTFIRIETRDGVFREGRLSGLRSRTFKLNGQEVERVEAVELNGDPSDIIPLDRIADLQVG